MKRVFDIVYLVFPDNMSIEKYVERYDNINDAEKRALDIGVSVIHRCKISKMGICYEIEPLSINKEGGNK